MSLFSAVEMAPRDPILGLNEQFNADTNPNKVNLGVGVYFDDNGKLPLLQCVQAAEKTMMDKPTARGYLPIDGIAARLVDSRRESEFAQAVQHVHSGKPCTDDDGIETRADVDRMVISGSGIGSHRSCLIPVGTNRVGASNANDKATTFAPATSGKSGAIHGRAGRRAAMRCGKQ